MASQRRKSKRSKENDSPTVFSLFSGGGGLDLGLDAVGFHTAVATDIDFHSCISLAQLNSRARQLNHNRPALIVKQDIRALDPVAIAEAADLRSGEISVLSGGPPCQAFSIFGKRRGMADARGTLAFEYLRVLKALNPETFLFENVFGLLTIDGGKLLELIVDKLSRPARGMRYEVSVLRLNSVNFGVPQYRDRVFLIGTRIGKAVGTIDSWTVGTTDLFAEDKPTYRIVRDALRGLPKIGNPDIANHTGREHSDRIIDRYRSLKPGERDPKTRINKLDLDKPSFTIIVGSDKGGGKGHVHPTEPREVTPRESARIQTFPDWWSFSGTSRHPIRQIGNAVPPLLAAAVGNAIATQTFGRRGITLMDAVQALGQEHLFQRR